MKAPVLITAAGPSHGQLLHQTLVTQENQRLSMARFLLDLVRDGASRVAFVVSPESSASIRALLAGSDVTLIEQHEPGGYAHALYQARDFVAGEPFLHLVGDHFYLAEPPQAPQDLIQQLLAIYEREQASVSAVQATRESLIGSFGAVAGPAVSQRAGALAALYQIETVIEKPTPTEAEQKLVSPGLRAGHYLCFFGIHLFSPGLMRILHEDYFAQGRKPGSVSEVLQQLAQRERYLACMLPGRRFDLASKYGLLQGQLALALEGPDRESILAMLVESLAR